MGDEERLNKRAYSRDEELSEFVPELRRNARLLLGIGASSIVVSGLATFAASGPGLPTSIKGVAILAGSVAGAFAVAITYHSTPVKPIQYFLELSPKQVAGSMKWSGVGVLVFLSLFLLLAERGSALCVLPGGLMTFVLYRALTLFTMSRIVRTSCRKLSPERLKSLAAEAIARKEREWNTNEEFEEQSRKLDADLEESREMAKSIASPGELKREERRRRLLRWMATPWRLTKGLRKRIGLLTIQERIDALKADASAQRFIKRLFARGARLVLDGQGARARLEATDREIWRAEDSLYTVLEGTVLRSTVTELVEDLRGYRDEKDDRVTRITVVVRDGTDLSEEARLELGKRFRWIAESEIDALVTEEEHD